MRIHDLVTLAHDVLSFDDDVIPACSVGNIVWVDDTGTDFGVEFECPIWTLAEVSIDDIEPPADLIAAAR